MSATPQTGPVEAAMETPKTASEAGETTPLTPEAQRAQALEEVLAAAARAFMERGFAATSIDDVARRMGATKGRVYHYYRSKLDLFTDVTRRSLEMIYDQCVAAEAEGGTPRERLERMMRLHVRSILLDQPWHRCAMQGVEMHLRDAATAEQRAAVSDLIRMRHDHEMLFLKVIHEGIEAGEFRPCDPAIAVRTLLPALNGGVYWYRRRPDETEADLNRIIDEIVAFSLGGLLAD